jgi:hypothetical protein
MKENYKQIIEESPYFDGLKMYLDQPLENEEVTGDYIHEYTKQWIDQENWTDFNIVHSMSVIMGMELLSHMLVNEKCCIDSANSYEPRIEKEIEKLAKQFSKLSKKKQNEYYDYAFKDCHMYSCKDCHHVSFVNDGNDELYPELKTECWECKSKNIEFSKWRGS